MASDDDTLILEVLTEPGRDADSKIIADLMAACAWNMKKWMLVFIFTQKSAVFIVVVTAIDDIPNIKVFGVVLTK